MTKNMHPHGLTTRELEALSLLAKGRTDIEIAAEMHITEGSVGNLISATYAKISWLFGEDETTRSRIAKLVRWYILTYECAQGCLRSYTTYNTETGETIVNEKRDFDYLTEIRLFTSTTALNEYVNSIPHPLYQLHSIAPAPNSQGSRYIIIWRRPLRPPQQLTRIELPGEHVQSNEP